MRSRYCFLSGSKSKFFILVLSFIVLVVVLKRNTIGDCMGVMASLASSFNMGPPTLIGDAHDFVFWGYGAGFRA